MPLSAPFAIIDAPPAIRVRGAALSYGGTQLFDGLDLDLPAGLCTCLLGPSGVGKSSLLRLVAGLAPPMSGVVDCDDGRPLAGRYAFMAQQDLLLPWLTILENLVLGYRLRRQTAPQERAHALLAALGLEGTAARRPNVLSGGMRQRAALARTLVEDRPVVLMDEPFSALDAVTRLRLQDLMAELFRGRTVFLVTHDPLEALRLGHRVLVLNGRPARLSQAIEPAGEPPRDVGDPALLELQALLLRQLAGQAP